MNKKLFKDPAKKAKYKKPSIAKVGVRLPNVPKMDTFNKAGGRAYQRPDEEALAVFACTGRLNGTFYSSAKDEFNQTITLASKCSPETVLKIAVHARTSGYMKDMPALLLAYVISREYHNTSPEAKRQTIAAFNIVCDNVKMLRNIVEIIRSGKLGKKSLGAFLKKQIEAKLASMTDDQIFKGSVGNNPSLADIIKLTHPNPVENPNGHVGKNTREALYRYLIGKEVKNKNLLPNLVKEYESFKKQELDYVPDVPFQMIAGLNVTDKAWDQIFDKAKYQMTLMNLNTAARHNVFSTKKRTKMIVDRLSDSNLLKQARLFPFTLYNAYRHLDAAVPTEVKNAVRHACFLSGANIPNLPGKYVVAVDISGSMSAKLDSDRAHKSSGKPLTCLDAASIFAMLLKAYNPHFDILEFNDHCRPNNQVNLETSLDCAFKTWGGTDIASVLTYIGQKHYDGIIILSDNETWRETYTGRSNLAQLWSRYSGWYPLSKMVLVDMVPNTTTQVIAQPNILRVGGMSDAVLQTITSYLLHPEDNFWINQIDNIAL